MTPSVPLMPSLATIAAILVAMAVIAGIEVAIPLHSRGRWTRMHLGPNLALTFLAFATNLILNLALVGVVIWLEANGFGLLRWLALPALPAAIIAIALLDFSFYAAHVSWHRIPSLWRFHAVHHSDPTVDVTTTIRQHPIESLLRYAALGAMAVAIGPGPAAFTVYRAASVLNGLLEHANLRAPSWLDAMLSLVTTWPHMHKIHHSRRPEQTNTNYSNLFSVWDRLFGTFTPSRNGTDVAYGLDGFDAPALQTTTGLLALPFARLRPARRSSAAASTLSRSPIS